MCATADFHSNHAAARTVGTFLDDRFNPERHDPALGYVSPMQYERLRRQLVREA
jgi:hypothetical protein